MLFQLSQKMPLHGVVASQRCAEKALCNRRSGRGPPNLRTVTPSQRGVERLSTGSGIGEHGNLFAPGSERLHQLRDVDLYPSDVG